MPRPSEQKVIDDEEIPGSLEKISPRVGLLGELDAEIQLALRGWHPVRLDTAQMASNADMVAIRGLQRVSLQIKTTDAEKQPRTQWLGFGYSTGYLKDGNAIFNSKQSPLVADVIVAVSYKHNASRFVVLPVALAEALCRRHADYWYNIPAKKRDTGKIGKRSNSFPIYLTLNANPKTHSKHHETMKKVLLAFENKWEILDEPIKKLHDVKAWPAIK